MAAPSATRATTRPLAASVSQAASQQHPLQSPDWHRVAALKPQLAHGVQSHRVWSRGQRWHVLHHPGGRQTCRLNPQAHAIAARLDGQISMDTLWQGLEQQAAHQAGQDAPSQDELIELLHRLAAHGLLAPESMQVQGSQPGTPWGGAPHASQALGAGHPAHGRSLWAWRLPLLDPSAWLDRHAHWGQALFSRTGACVWLALIGLMLGLWVLHAPEVQEQAGHGLLTPRSVWLSLLCYPFIKAVHEAAHALALHSQGRQVKACGLSFMMLMPVPYVDASEAHSLPRAWQRALVSAAGILAELALACLGMALWAWTEPGWWHDLGFVVWFVAGTSTLLFNGNPLQRMDGYHLLTDLLHLPNLATRSSHWWQARILRWAGGSQARHRQTPRMDEARPAPGELVWLVAHAPLAWLYQWGLWLGISLWLGAVSAPLGWLAGTATVARLALWPWVRLAGQLWQGVTGSTGGTGGTGQVRAWHSMVALLAPAALLLAPWPDHGIVQGVVWTPEQALIRPEVEGQVEAVLRQDGEAVQAGDALLRLRNPRLMAERERVAAQLERTLQGEFLHLSVNGGQAGQAADEATAVQARLDRLDEQIRSLTLTAHQAGTLRWPQPRDLPERYLHRGDLVGHVVDSQAVVVRVAMPQDQVRDQAREQARIQSASVRLSGQGSSAHPAVLMRDSLGATRQLHSPALSEAMGGDIPTDPKDEHHLQTLRPVVTMDLRVPGLRLDAPAHGTDTAPPRLGQRVWVRLDHGAAPLLWQWLSQARQHMDAAFSNR